MDEKLNITVYNKKEYKEIIDTEFSELISPPPENIQLSIDDFFILYEKFFYDIPATGLNSHESIIIKSSEYINYNKTNEEIQALLDEISLLREELLKKEKELLNNKVNILGKNKNG